MNNYKLVILCFISIIVVIFGCHDNAVKNNISIEYNDVSKYKLPDSSTLNISIPFDDKEALVDLGKYLGHMKVLPSNASCFGTCHNISKGGHPDQPLPSGGGKFRTVKNNLLSKYNVSNISLPDDKPLKDSPGILNGFLDSLVLWEGLSSNFPFELQFEKGRHAHMLDALEITAKHDLLAMILAKKAFGSDTINFEKIGCSIAAYEQTIISNRSRASKGLVKNNKGYKLYDNYCFDCHTSGKKMETFISDPILDIVKVPRLEGWAFSPCDFHTCEVPSYYSNRGWSIIKEHQKGIDRLNEISYTESLSIFAFIKNDLTDYELSRYE